MLHSICQSGYDAWWTIFKANIYQLAFTFITLTNLFVPIAPLNWECGVAKGLRAQWLRSPHESSCSCFRLLAAKPRRDERPSRYSQGAGVSSRARKQDLGRRIQTYLLPRDTVLCSLTNFEFGTYFPIWGVINIYEYIFKMFPASFVPFSFNEFKDHKGSWY